MLKKISFIKNSTNLKRWLFAVLLILISTAVILSSPNKRIYDETYYFSYIEDIIQKGFGIGYVKQMVYAAGPLYGFIHGIFYSWTKLDPIKTRLVNHLLFLGVGLAIYLYARSIKHKYSLNSIIALYSIPFIGVTYCLALTEIPAMFFMSIGAVTLMYWKEKNETINDVNKFILVLFSAIFMGISVWGRQNYFVVIAATPLLFIIDRKFHYKWFLTHFLVYSIISVFLFYLWGGIVPEPVRKLVSTTPQQESILIFSGFNLAHGIRGLGYTAITFLFIFPQIYRLPSRFYAYSALIAIAFGSTLAELHFLPSQGFIRKLFGDNYADLFKVIFGIFFLYISIIFSVAVLLNLWRQRFNYTYIFNVFALCFILASNTKILHQFSSRYVVVAAPFIILMGLTSSLNAPISLWRAAIGFAISIFLALNYYQT